jgi:cytochrome oxidase Cu insertion factor (SCO1/SenC/PrrC family)
VRSANSRATSPRKSGSSATRGATPASPFAFPSLRDGKPVQLADFRGRVVLVAFWYPT